jgi:hypothetical protein
MSDLATVLGQVRERIARYRGTAIGEESTKASLISPVLHALGWDLTEIDEVRHEYRRKSINNPVDYALLILREPRLFVEAKPLDANLDDHHWLTQILVYATEAGVGWLVLTNGDEYRIYNVHAPVPAEDKLFRSARISDESTQPADLLALIAKERMTENWIDTLWKAHFVDRQLKVVIDELFAGEPEATLVNLIAKRVSALSRADIKAGLTRARVHVDFPIEPLPPGSRPPALRIVERPQPGPGGTARRGRQRAAQPAAISLQELIGAGLIKPPLDLEKTYLGHRLTARVEADGSVAFGGQRYDSLSTAGGVARASVPGAPSDRDYPQTNGWIFWRFRDTDGRLKPIDDLRQRYRTASGANVS